MQKLKNTVNKCFGIESATEALADTLNKWASDILKRGRLCNCYVIWKLHEKANVQGVRSSPIALNMEYAAGQVPQFLPSS